MNKLHLSALLCLLLTVNLCAQTYSLEGVRSVSSQGIRAIMNGKEVGGYIIFYKKDKADGKNDNYGFDLLDEKLNKVSTVKVVLPKNVTLLQTVFNGEALGLMFYDPSKKNYIFKSYDKTLKLLGSKLSEKPNKWEQATLNQMAGGDTDEVFYMFGIRPVAGKGFVRSGYGESKDQTKVTFYDNMFKEKWSYQTPSDSKDYELFMLSDVNEKYVSGTTMRRKGMMSRKIDYFLTVFDTETGKKLIDLSAEKENQQMSITSTILQEGSDQILLQGEYYDLEDKPTVNKSKGFYIKTYDLKSGKEISESLYSWDKDIAKLFDAKAKASIEDKYQNYPQAFFKMADDKYYMVFEQFKKVADGGGIAMKALGASGAGVSQVKIGNLWVMEMDKTFKPVSIKYYEKDGSKMNLPPGIDIAGAGFAGYFTHYIGGFDYQFLQQSNDRSTFNIAYINYDREKGEKTKVVVGNIFMPKDGILGFDKVDITSPKNTTSFLYPATLGSVMLAQYQRKAKRVDFKLVKLNY